MLEIYKGAPAEWLGVPGEIVRLDVGGRNLWWRADRGDTEIMFSLRRDGAWRSFPGKADAEGLLLLGAMPVPTPKVPRSVACKNGHLRTEENTGKRKGKKRDGSVKYTRCCLECERASYHRNKKTAKKELTLV